MGRLKLKRIDRNQVEITRFLEEAGCQVLSLTQIGKGCPDILISYNNLNILVEIKNTGTLNDKQKLFHHQWNAPIEIVYNIEDAKNLLKKYNERN